MQPTQYAIRYTIYDIRYTGHANRRNTPNSATTPNKPPIQPNLSTNYDLIMQNKANFRKVKLNVTKVLTKDYENISNLALDENKPNTKPTCRGVAPGEAGSNPISHQRTTNPELRTNNKQSQFQALGDSGFGCTASCLFGFSLRSCLQEQIVVFCWSYLRRACEVALNAKKIPSISKGD